MKTIKVKFLTFFLLVIFLPVISYSNIFTVTNTSDSGSGSLRDAITQAVAIPAASHSIVFNIPQTDHGYNSTTHVWVISPLSTYPYITRSNITIDGTTQTTNRGDTNPYGPEIMLNGNNNTIDFAFFITNSSHITIKGLIISRFTYGIQIQGDNAKYNEISGNYIGTDATGTDTLGNNIGIEMFDGTSYNTVGGSDAASRNIVSGNEHIGIRALNSNHNVISGNFVGTDRTGMLAKGNYDGISIEGTAAHNYIGGITPGERNLVSGNADYGIPIFGAGADSNIVYGNYIGTNINGTAGIPNTYGVLFDDGAEGNLVGGYNDNQRNIISGNSGYGCFLYNLGTTRNYVINNYIGTDPTGTFAVPNGNGIVIDGACDHHVVDKNVISGNNQMGIDIHITGSDHHLITRNLIGTDKTGLLPLGNAYDGIRIGEGPKYNIIGGNLSSGNIIAFNGNNGVTVMNDNDIYNRISCNSIYQNVGMGIDLLPPGINPNDPGDPDTGPNMRMNYPLISSVQYIAGNKVVFNGTLDTQNPQSSRIELFIADVNNAGFAQGKTFLDSITPNATGVWSDTITSPGNALQFTSTATDANGNTSEFSIATPLAINENSPEDVSADIYPNPLTNNSVIRYSVNQTGTVSISIIDCCGRIVETYLGAAQAEGEYSVPCKKLISKDLRSGIYFCRIATQNGCSKTLKLIIR